MAEVVRQLFIKNSQYVYGMWVKNIPVTILTSAKLRGKYQKLFYSDNIINLSPVHQKGTM